jgi:aminoglycoside phosphotransferase (APT) family kinase protein
MVMISVGEKSGWATEDRHIPIRVDEVARLLEGWRGARPVTAATLLAGGLMNRNYRVSVGDDDVVLRFYDRDARSSAKEVSLLSELRGRLPVPSVLHVAPETETVPFVVLEFVDGVTMRDLKRTGDAGAIAEASYSIGLELATLASLRLGDRAIIATDVVPNAELLSGSNVNARLIDHFLESAVLRERLGEEHVPHVHDFAWRHDDALSATHVTSGIAHGDFNSANILVRQRAGRWSVAAILDWEFAFAGSVAYDIGNFLRYERATRSRFEPWFGRGLVDGGVELPSDWRTTGRVADLSALCEFLTRPAIPQAVAEEVRDLVLATLEGRELSAS